MYDIIIIGAGVSGLYLAKLLNNSDLKVLLIEKRNTIMRLPNHKYGTFRETVKKFSLERFVIKNFTKFGFYGSEEGTCFSYEADLFSVVDMNKFAKTLKLTCDVKTGYTLRKVERTNNKIIVNETFEAKIIVDCSGNSQVVSHHLGLQRNNDLQMFSTSFELIHCNISSKRLDEFWFMTDLHYTNVGLWFYPYSKTKCQIGHTDFYSASFPIIKDQEKSLPAFIKNVEPYSTWLKDSKITEIVRKTGPTTTLSSLYSDNFISCGDAAGAGTPIVGEGFRIALEMALSAHETIMKAFKQVDFSKKVLINHKNNFNRKIGKYYIWSRLLRHLILHYFSNKEYDSFAKNLGKLSREELYLALKSEFSGSILFKMVDLEMLFGITKNAIRKLLGIELNKRITK